MGRRRRCIAVAAHHLAAQLDGKLPIENLRFFTLPNKNLSFWTMSGKGFRVKRTMSVVW